MSHAPTGLDLYDRTADAAAGAVIARYSTSFALACRLLGPRLRTHVRNVYSLVRVADEVVDGPASDAGLDTRRQREVLDALEHDTLRAMDEGFSANLVVHAFARTARATGISPTLVTPFFASMRVDLDTATHDELSHEAYVYGSAEVVGLMCLQIFVNADAAEPGDPDEQLVDGARRLGRAFQDVNFLRDLDDDSRRLGRDYLDGAGSIERRSEVLDRIDGDLAAAAAVIPRLPRDCRRAVWTAHDLFAELSRRLRATPIGAPRVRVPDRAKAAIAVRAAVKARKATP